MLGFAPWFPHWKSFPCGATRCYLILAGEPGRERPHYRQGVSRRASLEFDAADRLDLANA